MADILLERYFLGGADLMVVLQAASLHFEASTDKLIHALGGFDSLPISVRFLRFRAAHHLGIIPVEMRDDLRAVSRLAAMSESNPAFDPCDASSAAIIANIHAWRNFALGGSLRSKILVDPELRLRAALASLTIRISEIVPAT